MGKVEKWANGKMNLARPGVWREAMQRLNMLYMYPVYAEEELGGGRGTGGWGGGRKEDNLHYSVCVSCLRERVSPSQNRNRAINECDEREAHETKDETTEVDVEKQRERGCRARER